MEKTIADFILFFDTTVPAVYAALLLLVGILVYVGTSGMRYRRRQRRLNKRHLKYINERLALLRLLDKTDTTKRN